MVSLCVCQADKATSREMAVSGLYGAAEAIAARGCRGLGCGCSDGVVTLCCNRVKNSDRCRMGKVYGGEEAGGRTDGG